MIIYKILQVKILLGRYICRNNSINWNYEIQQGWSEKIICNRIDSDVSDIVKYLRRNSVNTSYNLKKKYKIINYYAYENNYDFVMLDLKKLRLNYLH